MGNNGFHGNESSHGRCCMEMTENIPLQRMKIKRLQMLYTWNKERNYRKHSVPLWNFLSVDAAWFDECFQHFLSLFYSPSVCVCVCREERGMVQAFPNRLLRSCPLLSVTSSHSKACTLQRSLHVPLLWYSETVHWCVKYAGALKMMAGRSRQPRIIVPVGTLLLHISLGFAVHFTWSYKWRSQLHIIASAPVAKAHWCCHDVSLVKANHAQRCLD